MLEYQSFYFFMAYMLEILPQFYTHKRLPSTQYHEEPPGELDISRLIQREPACFVRESYVDTRVRKAIVFADHSIHSRFIYGWQHRYWDEEDVEPLIMRLHDFLDDGFKLYLLQNSHLCLLESPRLLRHKEVQQRIMPMSRDDVYQLAFKEHRLQRKEVLIIDYHHYPLLFGRSAIPENRYIAEDIEHRNIHLPIHSNQATTIITTPDLWFKLQEESYAGRLKNMRSVLEVQRLELKEALRLETETAAMKIPVSWNIWQLKITASDLLPNTPNGAWCITNAAHLSHVDSLIIEIGGCSLTSERSLLDPMNAHQWLHTLKTLHISYFIDLPNLSSMHQLKELYIKRVGSISLLSELSSIAMTSIYIMDVRTAEQLDFPHPFNTLKHLSIVSAPVCFSLHAFPSLQTLILEKVSREQMAVFFHDSVVLHHLIEFRLSIESESWDEWLFEWLEQQSQYMPNLRVFKLSLQGACSNAPMLAEKKPSFLLSQNVEVELSLFNVTAMETIIRLSGYFKNIKKLCLICETRSPCFDSIPLPQERSHFSQLEDLELTYNKHSSHETILTFLLNGPQRIKRLAIDQWMVPWIVKNIDIHQIKYLKIEPENDVPSHLAHNILSSAYLESINLYNIPFKHPNDKVLKEPIHWENVHYLSCSTSQRMHVEMQHSLTQLRKLRLFDIANVDYQMIATLIQQNPSLQCVKLHGCIKKDKLTPLLSHIPCVEVVSYYYDDEEEEEEDHLIDCMTEDNGITTFHVIQYFTPVEHSPAVDPSSYRLAVFQQVAFNEGRFQLSKQPNKVFKVLDKTYEEEMLWESAAYYLSIVDQNPIYHHYQGRQIFNCLSQDWKAIASLTPRDKITHWKTVPPEQDIELAYCDTENLFYVHMREGMASFELQFELLHPTSQPKMPPKLARVVNHFNQFSAGASGVRDNMSLIEAASSIYDHKVGACRHRAIVFFVLLTHDSERKANIRIIENDSHMYAELQDNHGRWLTCDLGGYDANQVILTPTLAITTADGHFSNAPSLSPLTTRKNTPLEDAISDAFDARMISRSDNRRDEVYGTLETYIQDVFASPALKQRLDLTKDLHLSLLVSLKKAAVAAHRPLFYVDAPDELICSRAFILQNPETHEGQQQEGPGGPLYDFLTTHPNGILVVNYTTFTEKDFAQWRGLLAHDRQADSIRLPKEMLLIGLFDKTLQQAPEPCDFELQFNLIRAVPNGLVHPILRPRINPYAPCVSSQKEPPSLHINLCHSANWRHHLIDHWGLDRQTLRFEQSTLSRALTHALPIEIQNPPDDEHFWRHLILHHEDAWMLNQFVFTTGYDWAWPFDNMAQTAFPNEDAYVLNPSLLTSYFSGYTLDKESGFLSQTLGHLMAETPAPLSIHITRDLTQDQWGCFYEAYQMHTPQRSLFFSCAKNIALPPHLKRMGVQESKPYRTFDHTQLIQTNDRDLALLQIEPLQNPYIWDISECSSRDLLPHLRVVDSASYRFEEKEGPLLVLLENGANVILTGVFSAELLDRMAPFILARERNETAPGQLILISEVPIPFMRCVSEKNYTEEHKKKSLEAQGFSSSAIDSKPHVFQQWASIRQRSALLHEQHYPSHHYLQAWDGLHRLQGGIHLGPVINL